MHHKAIHFIQLPDRIKGSEAKLHLLKYRIADKRLPMKTIQNASLQPATP